MAILNQRLVPLIEILTELGVDWLAFELIDGIRRGEEPEEDERALALTRERTKTGHPVEMQQYPPADDGPKPYADDGQLEWAVRYICERLGATLTEMTDSIDVLDEIVDDGDAKRLRHSGASAVLVLDGAEHAVGRAQVKAAQARLPELRKALDDWVNSTRSEQYP